MSVGIEDITGTAQPASQAQPESAARTRIRKWLPGTLTVLMLVLAVWVLHRSLHGTTIAEVVAHNHALGRRELFLALILTLASYLLLTLYDLLALRHVGSDLPWKSLAPTAFCASAIGHNVGFAALSGGAIRYRAYTGAGIDATRIATVVLFISVTFFLGASPLLGAALWHEPVTLLQSIPVPIVLVRLLGVVLLILPVAYLVWTRLPGASIRIGNWQVQAPKGLIAFGQIALGMLDLAVAAAVVFVLLPPTAGLSYLNFLGIYLLCLAVAVISNVPGGLGVFEGSMLLLLPDIPNAELLGSLLAFRVVYYLLPLGVAMLVLGVQVVIEPNSRVKPVLKQGSLILTRAAPQILSAAVFIAGAVLLFSGSLPSASSRLHYVSELLPDSLMQISHLLGSAIGFMLLVLARGLYRRLEGAYWVTLATLAAGSLVSLLKGFDYEEALVLVFAGALLWSGRRYFDRKAALLEEPFTGGWLLSMAMVVGAAVWLGFFAWRHVAYSNSFWWNFAADDGAPKMLRASLVLVVLLAGFGLSRLLRASPSLSQPATEQEIVQAARVVQRGSSAEANVALTGDKRFLFHAEGDAFVMYQLSGRSVIAMGDPVGNEARFNELTWSYREMCDKLDKRCVFYQVTERYLPLYIDLGLSFSKLGEEAQVPLSDFTLEGRKRAELRQARNRGLRDGASFEIVKGAELEPVMAELKIVSDEWLANKHVKEKGFSIGSFDPRYLVYTDVAIVRVAGQIVAFANLWKAGDKSELSIDLMRHRDGPLKGVMDYLFTELMLWGREQGYREFSLGMAPLSGLEHHPLATLWHKVGNLVFRFGDEFYNFEGLRHYKQKFAPEWRARYLAAPGGTALPAVLIDATTLISGGVRSVFIK